MSDSDTLEGAWSRRAVLAALTAAGAAGVGTGGAVRTGATGATALPRPGLEWYRTYESSGLTVQITDLVAASAGGLALMGTGLPEEGPPRQERMLVVRTDEAGDEQWRAYADDDIEAARQDSRAITETSDGGFAVGGFARHPDEPQNYKAGTAVAEVAKVTAGGSVAWVETFDGYEDDDPGDDEPDGLKEDSAIVFDVAPGPDGGVVGVGFRNLPPWAVKLAADGTVEWELTHPERNSFVEAHAKSDGGYVLVANPEENDPYHALHVTEGGTVERQVSLAVDYDEIPSSHRFVPLADGDDGYAYTGRNFLADDMVLSRLDAAGDQQWTSYFDGPGHFTDWAHALIQTADGGFALAGFMTAQSGQPRPALVKAGADGSEEWKTVLNRPEEVVGDTGYRTLVQTGEDRFATVAVPYVVSYDPEAAAGTPTPTPPPRETTTRRRTTVRGTARQTTERRGPEPTPTPTDTPTDQPTPTAEPTTTGGGGPGFGVLGALAGLVSLAALRNREGES